MENFDFTPEQVGEMNDRNESFCGHTADFLKVRKYEGMKERMTGMVTSVCGAVKKVEFMEPNQYEQNATLYMDMDTLVMLDQADKDDLCALIQDADRVTIFATNSVIRFTFGVENVWTD